ncbi:MAG TPA: enolase C-terminal domain-like protein [Candidatus Binatia bacterium]|nr:enolase C-terminal domain-like protein [Candidatus Binatia bacterium]
MAKQAENASARESASISIKSVQTWRAVLRRAVAWKTARYTKGDIEATVVGITDTDGIVGYGYMPSMSIVGESPLSSESLIQALLVPVMKDRSFVGIQPVLREVEQVLGGNFQTKFAIEEALWDLLAKKLQTPLVNLIGGACRLEVPVMRMLGLKPPQETAAEAKALVDRGYRHVKVKIGVDEKRDLETVRRVRDTIGEDVFLSADANQAYAPMEAVRVLRQLENANLGLVEQPVRRDDVRGMAFVRQNVSVPIMADEGIETATDALRHIEAGAMDAVSIKLWKMGGLYRGRDIASVCNAANVRVHVGSTAGSQLLEAIQLHFCASLPDLFGGAEISEFESLTDDPASGLVVENGALRVPSVPGLGVMIDHNKLRETTGLWEGK